MLNLVLAKETEVPLATYCTSVESPLRNAHDLGYKTNVIYDVS
jgi:hypothetical protein